MVEKDVFLTLAGVRKLEADLAHLKRVRRKEATVLREALAAGCTWENPDYEVSKMELAFIESRIQTLENLLKNAQVIDGREMTTDEVQVGHRVRLCDIRTGEELEFMIVGSVEADPAASRISHRSPVAQAILGRKVGDIVKVEVPAGQLVYKIMTIGVAPVW
ncbi:MAG: transcription elongation factor GreA [Firmicutes bacterium]|nr:transcription elongation factor GreA [Bacillota bacterium]